MARIKIIAVPPGEAPESVRKEWVGLILPIAENAPAEESSCQMGANGGRPENLGGYPVETEEAVKILQKKSPEAANWWEENIPLELMPWLVFKKGVCELLN